MSTSPAIDKNEWALGERRLYLRERPDSVILVFFGKGNWGKLIDLNEKGMCIEFAHPPTLREPINFTFEVTGCVIRPAGQVKWIREFERTAGVLFLDLAEESRNQTRHWISLKTGKDLVKFGSEWISQSAAEIPPSADPETLAPSQACETIVSSADAPNRATGLSGELPRHERQIAHEVSALNHQWRRTVSVAVLVCLAVLSFTGGMMRNVLKSSAVRDGGESARSRSERKVTASQAMERVAARSPYPFMVEVRDTENRVWVLQFDDTRQNHSEQTADNLPLMASPPIAKNDAAAKQERIRQNGQLAHHFNLVSPSVPARRTGASVADSAAPVAPAIPGRTSATPEMAAGPVGPTAPIPAPVEAVVPVGGDVQPARLIRATRPVYPVWARANRVQGDVTLSALIDAGGHPKDIKVLSGPLLLREAAIEAVRQWKYEAARLDGKPTVMSLTVTVAFHLN